MTPTPSTHVVVVDGSNLATEGRTTPSLRQLDEAVRAYAAEDPGAEIVVVVDASFEHRVDPSERKQLVDAELHGEIVSPPAGAIGRGDAFVLRIAERTGATVLSNDSFQEFHGEHPWLFDKGRLVGGKPVPGVGWIFTPRLPVRGPKSRQAQGKGKGAEAQALSPPVKAAELAKAAKKVAARKALLPDGSAPKVGDVWPQGAPPAAGAPGATAKKAKKAKKVGPAVAVEKSAKAKGEKRKAATVPAPGGAAEEPAVATTKKAAAKAGAKKEAPVKAAAARKDATKKAAAKKKPVEKGPARKESAKKQAPAKAAAKKEVPAKAAMEKQATTKKAAKAAQAKATVVPVAASRAKAARSTAAKNPAVAEAIGHALAEAIAPSEDGRRDHGDKKGGKGKDGRHRRRRAASPPPAVNEPLAFITFVATYPLERELEGEVVSFTSHGAMVDVDLPGGGVLHSYIPLAAMGDPPPTKARQVLKRGERRRFVLVALDPPRRVAELALPELASSQSVAGR